ncbi:MAG: hypothetical protein IJ345_06995 [Clostridia bacterium]|nr:hypothetical protein [Clostridia bacterium]
MKASDKIKQEFISPSVKYRGKPFWSWNGELRGEELVRQAHVMKEMGLGGYFMHSRSGLITEYLGDEWFDLINQVADAAEADGMEAWLYDEDRWPSGSAGGKVTVDPQYRMKSLYVYESDIDRVEWDEQSLFLFIAKIDGINIWTYKMLKNITSTEDAAKALSKAVEGLSDACACLPGKWRALRFAIVPDKCNSNYNGTTYIDTMSRKATEKFIEMTHEEYKNHCGDRLGRSIKGIFTDEPHRGHCLDNFTETDGVISCAMCWTDDIFDEFRVRYGYDPEPIIPELFYRPRAEKVAPIKLHYIDLADELFLERFAKPINEWCEKNGIIFTGHVLHEDSLMNQTVPEGSLMRFYEHMGYPGIDCLSEHNRCYWIAKQLSSAARQLGKKWLLSELYGCTGWQFNFKSHKAVGDWQALFGINLRCQHLSWYTMEGQSKRDYPASILHQSPWYKDYSKVEDYFARFGLVISEGEADCDVLLLNPIESVWCQAYMGWARWIFSASEDIDAYEKRYARTFHILAENQIDFDYGEEEMMSRMASVETDTDGEPILKIGKAKYHVVIVTNMLTVRPTTLALLKSFMEQGGTVIFAGDVPTYVNAVASDEPERLASAQGAIRVAFDEDEIVAAIRNTSRSFVNVVRADGETEKAVFAQVRKSFGENGYAIAVLNTDRENAKKDLVLKITVPEGYFVEEWDLESGARYDASAISVFDGKTASISFDLEAAGTKCFVFTKEKEALAKVSSWSTVAEATVSGDFDYTTDEQNACVLDWVRWRWKDGEWHDETEVLRADREIRTDVGIEWRGGEMLQPWYSKLNDTKKYGEIELEYEFFVDIMPEGEIFLAGERPELNSYKLNGVSLTCEDINDFWIDDCFKRMRIPEGALRLGRNTVTVDVTFMRTTNVESLYLVGDFGVKLDGKKRSLTALPRLLGCESYATYDMPFYTGSITYHLTADHYAEALGADGDAADRIVISPEHFTGGCVKVTALGKTTILGWDPYEADVTEAYRIGAPIDITVVGTRRNLFGPLHLYPNTAIGCDPNRFMTSGSEWTDDYCLIDSGLTGIVFKAQSNEKLIISI